MRCQGRHGVRRKEMTMMNKLTAALAALCLVGVTGMAGAADKPTDPQIAQRRAGNAAHPIG